MNRSFLVIVLVFCIVLASATEVDFGFGTTGDFSYGSLVWLDIKADGVISPGQVIEFTTSGGCALVFDFTSPAQRWIDNDGYNGQCSSDGAYVAGFKYKSGSNCDISFLAYSQIDANKLIRCIARTVGDVSRTNWPSTDIDYNNVGPSPAFTMKVTSALTGLTRTLLKTDQPEEFSGPASLTGKFIHGTESLLSTSSLLDLSTIELDVSGLPANSRIPVTIDIDLNCPSCSAGGNIVYVAESMILVGVATGRNLGMSCGNDIRIVAHINRSQIQLPQFSIVTGSNPGRGTCKIPFSSSAFSLISLFLSQSATTKDQIVAIKPLVTIKFGRYAKTTFEIEVEPISIVLDASVPWAGTVAIVALGLPRPTFRINRIQGDNIFDGAMSILVDVWALQNSVSYHVAEDRANALALPQVTNNTAASIPAFNDIPGFSMDGYYMDDLHEGYSRRFSDDGRFVVITSILQKTSIKPTLVDYSIGGVSRTINYHPSLFISSGATLSMGDESLDWTFDLGIDTSGPVFNDDKFDPTGDVPTDATLKFTFSHEIRSSGQLYPTCTSGSASVTLTLKKVENVGDELAAYYAVSGTLPAGTKLKVTCTQPVRPNSVHEVDFSNFKVKTTLLTKGDNNFRPMNVLQSSFGVADAMVESTMDISLPNEQVAQANTKFHIAAEKVVATVDGGEKVFFQLRTPAIASDADLTQYLSVLLAKINAKTTVALKSTDLWLAVAPSVVFAFSSSKVGLDELPADSEVTNLSIQYQNGASMLVAVNPAFFTVSYTVENWKTELNSQTMFIATGGADNKSTLVAHLRTTPPLGVKVYQLQPKFFGAATDLDVLVQLPYFPSGGYCVSALNCDSGEYCHENKCSPREELPPQIQMGISLVNNEYDNVQGLNPYDRNSVEAGGNNSAFIASALVSVALGTIISLLF